MCRCRRRADGPARAVPGAGFSRLHRDMRRCRWLRMRSARWFRSPLDELSCLEPRPHRSSTPAISRLELRGLLRRLRIGARLRVGKGQSATAIARGQLRCQRELRLPGQFVVVPRFASVKVATLGTSLASRKVASCAAVAPQDRVQHRTDFWDGERSPAALACRRQLASTRTRWPLLPPSRTADAQAGCPVPNSQLRGMSARGALTRHATPVVLQRLVAQRAMVSPLLEAQQLARVPPGLHSP